MLARHLQPDTCVHSVAAFLLDRLRTGKALPQEGPRHATGTGGRGTVLTPESALKYQRSGTAEPRDQRLARSPLCR
jgi:hypothetical protein